MDVTNEDHVRHALDYVSENLPAGQQGKNPHISCFSIDNLCCPYQKKSHAFSSLLNECEKKQSWKGSKGCNDNDFYD